MTAPVEVAPVGPGLPEVRPSAPEPRGAALGRLTWRRGVAGVGQPGGGGRRHPDRPQPAAPVTAPVQHHHRGRRHRRPRDHAGVHEVASPDPRSADRLGPGLVRRLPSLHLLLPAPRPDHRGVQRRRQLQRGLQAGHRAGHAHPAGLRLGVRAIWPASATRARAAWPPPPCPSSSSPASPSTAGTSCPPWPASSPTRSASRPPSCSSASWPPACGPGGTGPWPPSCSPSPSSAI